MHRTEVEFIPQPRVSEKLIWQVPASDIMQEHASHTLWKYNSKKYVLLRCIGTLSQGSLHWFQWNQPNNRQTDTWRLLNKWFSIEQALKIDGLDVYGESFHLTTPWHINCWKCWKDFSPFHMVPQAGVFRVLFRNPMVPHKSSCCASSCWAIANNKVKKPFESLLSLAWGLIP